MIIIHYKKRIIKVSKTLNMKILWFSVTPSLFSNETNQYNGGGWIASLERIVSKSTEITLGIAFIHTRFIPQEKIKKENNTIYYPMYIKRSWWEKQRDRFSSYDKDKKIIKKSIHVINDFKPDIIHIFGSEWCFGMLYMYTNCPIVIHMQGCWNSILNAQFPPGFSYTDELLKRIINPKSLILYILANKLARERAKREKEILKNTHYFMGRTRWDYALTRLYAPKSIYFHCEEALRTDFIQSTQKWKPHHNRNKITFVTTGGGNYLKGYDLVLKTANVLKENVNWNFEWNLLGPTYSELKYMEKKLGITLESVNVIAHGKKTSEEIKKALLESDIYIHTSYIDNSPNSICEAQYLGLPVISTNVGGIISLFDKKYDYDLLVPTNDPYYLAQKIIDTVFNFNKCEQLSFLNQSIAKNRHSDENIFKEIISIYKKILQHQ